MPFAGYSKQRIVETESALYHVEQPGSGFSFSIQLGKETLRNQSHCGFVNYGVIREEPVRD